MFCDIISKGRWRLNPFCRPFLCFFWFFLLWLEVFSSAWRDAVRTTLPALPFPSYPPSSHLPRSRLSVRRCPWALAREALLCLFVSAAFWRKVRKWPGLMSWTFLAPVSVRQSWSEDEKKCSVFCFFLCVCVCVFLSVIQEAKSVLERYLWCWRYVRAVEVKDMNSIWVPAVLYVGANITIAL